MSESRSWTRQWRFWRVQIGYRAYCHRYPKSSDRWVFQPYLIYDCPPAAAPSDQ